AARRAQRRRRQEPDIRLLDTDEVARRRSQLEGETVNDREGHTCRSASSSGGSRSQTRAGGLSREAGQRSGSRGESNKGAARRRRPTLRETRRVARPVPPV